MDLTYIKQTGESNGDAGDQYIGLDRFGRVVDQRWIVASTGVARDRFQYGYDRDSNRLYRDNLVNAAFGELYTYDGLNQVASFDRGTLNSTKTGITGSASRTQSWDYDALGNMDGVTTNGTTQSRTANAQNEITSIGSLTTPTYDANGNMTTDETGKQFVYDAWNRLVVVKNSGGTTLETFAYDASGRRVSGTASGVTTDLYYSAQWQVLEEQVSGSTTTQYVWSPVYVDAMILRDRDTDANGSLDERLWVQQDANWNVTAILNNSGVVVERYVYDAFGAATIYDASYTSPSATGYVWTHLFQGFRQDQVTGLYEADRRWLSPTLGRWVTMDPISYISNAINLYQFVENNGVNHNDMLGLMSTSSRNSPPSRISEPPDIKHFDYCLILLDKIFDIAKQQVEIANQLQSSIDKILGIQALGRSLVVVNTTNELLKTTLLNMYYFFDKTADDEFLHAQQLMGEFELLAMRRLAINVAAYDSGCFFQKYNPVEYPNDVIAAFGDYSMHSFYAQVQMTLRKISFTWPEAIEGNEPGTVLLIPARRI